MVASAFPSGGFSCLSPQDRKSRLGLSTFDADTAGNAKRRLHSWMCVLPPRNPGNTGHQNPDCGPFNVKAFQEHLPF